MEKKGVQVGDGTIFCIGRELGVYIGIYHTNGGRDVTRNFGGIGWLCKPSLFSLAFFTTNSLGDESHTK